MVNSEKKR